MHIGGLLYRTHFKNIYNKRTNMKVCKITLNEIVEIVKKCILTLNDSQQVILIEEKKYLLVAS